VCFGVGFRDTVKGNIKCNIKGKVTSNVKSDGQECPSHTCKVKRKSKVNGYGDECSSLTGFDQQAAWGVGGDDVYG
jgi:hypothetical protein